MEYNANKVNMLVPSVPLTAHYDHWLDHVTLWLLPFSAFFPLPPPKLPGVISQIYYLLFVSEFPCGRTQTKQNTTQTLGHGDGSDGIRSVQGRVSMRNLLLLAVINKAEAC